MPGISTGKLSSLIRTTLDRTERLERSTRNKDRFADAATQRVALLAFEGIRRQMEKINDPDNSKNLLQLIQDTKHEARSQLDKLSQKYLQVQARMETLLANSPAFPTNIGGDSGSAAPPSPPNGGSSPLPRTNNGGFASPPGASNGGAAPLGGGSLDSPSAPPPGAAPASDLSLGSGSSNSSSVPLPGAADKPQTAPPPGAAPASDLSAGPSISFLEGASRLLRDSVIDDNGPATKEKMQNLLRNELGLPDHKVTDFMNTLYGSFYQETKERRGEGFSLLSDPCFGENALGNSSLIPEMRTALEKTLRSMPEVNQTIGEKLSGF